MEDLWNNPENKPYAVFEGPNTREMPKLIKEGRTPISPEQLFYRKLEVLNEYLGALKTKDKKAIESWKARMHIYWDNLIDTGFGIAVHPDKGYKMVPDSQFLREINQKTKLLNGAAVMPDGMFEGIEGNIYRQKDVEKYGNEEQLLKDALTNPFLRELIPNKVTRKLAIINIFAQGKARFKYDEMMGIYFPDAQKQPVMCLWFVGGLESRSVADGGGSLDCGLGRLVGVRDVAGGDASMHERSSAQLEHILKAA